PTLAVLGLRRRTPDRRTGVPGLLLRPALPDRDRRQRRAARLRRLAGRAAGERPALVCRPAPGLDLATLGPARGAQPDVPPLPCRSVESVWRALVADAEALDFYAAALDRVEREVAAIGEERHG